MPGKTQCFAALFRLAVALTLLLKLLSHSHTALAYTPESPQVKEMVEAALKHLEGASGGRREGAVCLQGLAFVKANRPASHPKIQEAIASAQEMATKGRGSEGYAEAVACIFLCELDADRYATEIKALHNDVLKLQQPNGAWAYRGTDTSQSDTSLTQYGMLALWTAEGNGCPAPPGPVAQAARWLMQTQKQDGGFCYKPQSQSGSTSQSTLSLTTAGTGSLYMAAYLLGFRAKEDKKDDGLPPALQRVETESETQIESQGMSPVAIQRSCAAGDGWVTKNFGPENQVPQWTYYYLYGLERHMSFRDLVQGKKPEREPGWYNTGVRYLMKTQKKDGSWSGTLGPEIETSFAILFLVRSTQKSIKTAVFNEGTTIGGHGLPPDLTNIRMKDGKVVTPQMIREMDDWLEMLEGAEDKEFDPDALAGMSLDDDLTERTSQLERLRKLVFANEDYRARRAAIQPLAAARELDYVPILIYALTDNDSEVPICARDGLRLISRRFRGFGMPNNPTPAQKQAAADKWKKWYLSIRPDGELLD